MRYLSLLLAAILASGCSIYGPSSESSSVVY
jgi:hypothetical protein